MLFLDLKQGNPTFVQLQIYNITDNLMQRQRAYLVIRTLCHQFHSFTKLRNPQLQTVEANRLNTHLQLASKFLICHKRIVFDHFGQLLLPLSLRYTFDA
ncbi:hypothetical protein D3C76_1260660 [compost metagenome]